MPDLEDPIGRKMGDRDGNRFRGRVHFAPDLFPGFPVQMEDLQILRVHVSDVFRFVIDSQFRGGQSVLQIRGDDDVHALHPALGGNGMFAFAHHHLSGGIVGGIQFDDHP